MEGKGLELKRMYSQSDGCNAETKRARFARVFYQGDVFFKTDVLDAWFKINVYARVWIKYNFVTIEKNYVC